MAKQPTFLAERFAFDEPVTVETSGGVTRSDWAERLDCRAQVIYARGSEKIEAARLEGRPIYKLRIRQCQAAREITTNWRARDVRRGTEYSIREVDAVTDREWVYLVIEGGKAA